MSEGVVQPVKVGEVIAFAEEAGVAVVPALHDVQGQTVKMGTATTWYTKSVSWADEAVATGVKLSLAPFLFLHTNPIRASTMTTRVNYRKMAFEVYEPLCAHCGFGIPAVLEVAHIDGQRANNEIGNLVILCPNCHKMLDLDLISNETIIQMRDRPKIVTWSKRMKDAGKKAALTRKRSATAKKAVATRRRNRGDQS
ncbi:HNH endonuclease [Accumulibacter sp.]|uniref:HNH endonuclease n=1 Tax=Accumulibacter sp. TaxID=2053492 RepID=UPI002BC5EFE3|nr:HNH endonuclease [Accumulibacter sp.]HRF05472.1 HNH endonuclease [Accumulibacter sp.]